MRKLNLYYKNNFSLEYEKNWFMFKEYVYNKSCCSNRVRFEKIPFWQLVVFFPLTCVLPLS